MTEQKIQKLLQDADRMATVPVPITKNLSAVVKKRAGQRRIRNIKASIATAALLLIASGFVFTAVKSIQQKNEEARIADLHAQIKQLQASADATLKLVRKVIQQQQQQQRLDELNAQLAAIPDPLEELQKQIERTAFILLYQGDKMYTELNQKDSAIENYNRIIELFPQTTSAEKARQRLSELKNKNVNKNNFKI